LQLNVRFLHGATAGWGRTRTDGDKNEFGQRQSQRQDSRRSN
jgi:hypothetical protein